jgi:hypothetical protein
MGALNLGRSPVLSIRAGWLLDPEKPLLLVVESDGKVLLPDSLHLPRGVCVVICAALLAVGSFVLERAFPQ